jgi:aspartate/glutamate racemase
MNGPMYREMFRSRSMEVLSPSFPDQEIDGVIWSELLHGNFRESSKVRYEEVVQRLKVRGCDSVILGCTEIPLLVGEDDFPLPTPRFHTPACSAGGEGSPRNQSVNYGAVRGIFETGSLQCGAPDWSRIHT